MILFISVVHDFVPFHSFFHFIIQEQPPAKLAKTEEKTETIETTNAVIETTKVEDEAMEVDETPIEKQLLAEGNFIYIVIYSLPSFAYILTFYCDIYFTPFFILSTTLFYRQTHRS